MFSTTRVRRAIKISAVMEDRSASWAAAKGNAMGTDTTCAPTTSFSCQPKPLELPYCLMIEAGATCGVLWHCKQEAAATSGLAKTKELPVADVRIVLNSFLDGSFRKTLMMSASQSVARSRGLVGFSVASR